LCSQTEFGNKKKNKIARDNIAKSRAGRFSRLFIFTLFVLLFVTPSFTFAQEKLPKEVRWVRESVEYAAICEQTYRAAWQSVKTMATAMTDHWAVVLDVDETVLDNSPYQVELYERGETFSPKTWAEWVNRMEAKAVPGAKAFLDSVRTLGELAHIVFITNRDADLEQATFENLRKHGLWQDEDVLLCRRDRSDTKEIRRQEVLKSEGRCQGLGKRKIIALIGDQIGDLLAKEGGKSAQELKESLLSSWELGIKYFLLPNPMYGSWERGYR
jgi:5'-nucleotidase (lipoprotein e(P4) family)